MLNIVVYIVLVDYRFDCIEYVLKFDIVIIILMYSSYM